MPARPLMLDGLIIAFLLNIDGIGWNPGSTEKILAQDFLVQRR